MAETTKNDSVVDRVSTYAVENTALEDIEDTQNLFFLEIIPDSDQEVELPEISDVIKINLL